MPRSVSEQARQALQAGYGYSIASWPAQDDIAGWRERIALADGYMSAIADQYLARSGDFERSHIAGIPVAVTPAMSALSHEKHVVLDIHEGGLISGGGHFVSGSAARSTALHGVPTVSVDYRMPPDHPFPAGLEDCLAVYAVLLDQHLPQHILVSGQSAGGNLAAALMLLARSRGFPMPGGLLLLSPEVDLTESGDSFETLDGIDPTLTSLATANRLYAAGASLGDPLLSPLFADHHGFPPTFLQAGTRDLYLSNTVRMHRSLRNAGVDAELHVFEAMPHGGFHGAPEGDDLDAEIRRFGRRIFSPA